MTEYRETWAREIKGHRLRIECPDDMPVAAGYKTTVMDVTTGEQIFNVHKILLMLKPDELINATIGLLHTQGGQVSEETTETQNVSVSLTTYVEQAKDVQP
jgi:hypothetical protein